MIHRDMFLPSCFFCLSRRKCQCFIDEIKCENNGAFLCICKFQSERVVVAYVDNVDKVYCLIYLDSNGVDSIITIEKDFVQLLVEALSHHCIEEVLYTGFFFFFFPTLAKSPKLKCYVG